MAILIVGGAGYIGAHVNKLLHESGYETVVLDNLVTGHRSFARWGTFIEGDLGDRATLDRIFAAHTIEAVMHFAAFACVGESVTKPSMYYDNNVAKTLTLLDAMAQHRVNNFVFSSTCATFGNVERVPIDERQPQRPVSPYGRSKLMVEQILRDYDTAYGLRHCIFRYFNAAGADANGEIGEWHTPETHLIPIVLDVAIGKRTSVSVFGNDYPTPDGTCIRDYIHVSDLADAHQRGLERLLRTGVSDDYNLGCGQGHSVQEVLVSARKITGHAIPATPIERRAGDPPTLVGSSEKARNILGWIPTRSLDDCIESAWRWHKQNLQSS